MFNIQSFEGCGYCGILFNGNIEVEFFAQQINTNTNFKMFRDTGAIFVRLYTSRYNTHTHTHCPAF